MVVDMISTLGSFLDLTVIANVGSARLMANRVIGWCCRLRSPDFLYLG